MRRASSSLILALFAVIAVSGFAQNGINNPAPGGSGSGTVNSGTTGQPAVYPNAGGPTVGATPLYLDASQFTGGDAAAQIDAALAASAATTPVDAEAFNGVLNVTLGANGIFSPARRGWLKFGCVQTFKSTTLPMMVQGSGLHTSGCGSDSHLSTNDALNSVELKYIGSAPAVPTPIFCYGDSTGGCDPVGGGAFNSPMEYMDFEANNILNVIPFNNSYAQENSPVSHIRADNFKGDGIQISFPDETACTHCQNFLLYDYLAQQHSDACTAVTHPLFVNANTFGIKLLKGTLNLNSGSGSCTTTAPDSIARVSASGLEIDTLHIEANSTNLPSGTHGLLVGFDRASNNNYFHNLSFAQMNLGDCIRISNAFSSGNITIIAAAAQAAGCTNTLNDQVRGIAVVNATTNKIGFYSIGDNGDCSTLTTLKLINCFPTGIASVYQPFPEYVAGAGTAQAQTATLVYGPLTPTLTTGLTVKWLPTAANTATAPTLAVSGLTAKAITKCGALPLIANDLTATAIAEAVYDGTQFQLINPQTGCAPRYAPIPSSDTISAAGAFATTQSVAGTNLAPGSLITFRVHGVYTTSATAAPQMGLNMSAGGTASICPGGSATTLTISITNGFWDAECFIQIVTTGNPGTAIAWGQWTTAAANGSASSIKQFSNASTVNYITTTAQTASVNESATAVSGQTFTLQVVDIQVRY